MLIILVILIVVFGIVIFNREAVSRFFEDIQSSIRGAEGGEILRPALEDDEASPLASPPIPTPEPAPVLQQPTPPSQQAPAPSPPAEQGSAQGQAEQQERALYFIQTDGNAGILVRTNSMFPVSNTPMTDVLQALIAGPNQEESRMGLISLIPSESKLLSVTVEGNTAYINFNEDFQYNRYGVEGYEGQVRQLVFTATEFPTVKNVQILVEGRRIDYLGDVVWIGEPLNREALGN